MTWEWVSLTLGTLVVLAGTIVRMFGVSKPSAVSFAMLNFRVQQLERTVEKMDLEIEAGFNAMRADLKKEIQRLYDKLDGTH